MQHRYPAAPRRECVAVDYCQRHSTIDSIVPNPEADIVACGEPHTYLAEVFTKITNAHPDRQPDDLLRPHREDWVSPVTPRK
jgi:hypothetical protein